MNNVLSILLFSCLSLIISCSDSDRSRIEETLDKREKAFETHSVELYASIISPDYKAVEGDRVVGVEEVKKNFESIAVFFDELDIAPSKRSIYIQGNGSKVVQRVRVRVKMEKENIESSFALTEVLELKKIGDRWFITKEADRDYAEGFVFGGS